MLGGSIRRPLLARWLLTFCHAFDSLPALPLPTIHPTALETIKSPSQHPPMGKETHREAARIRVDIHRSGNDLKSAIAKGSECYLRIEFET
jgi:hypothetical protein